MDKIEIIRNYNSLSLAYVGDAAYEILVRKYILEKGITVNGQMHLAAKRFVSAAAQKEKLELIWYSLTEQEKEVAKRGRNAKSHSHPKNANLSDYHSATGFEALFGFLYLSESFDRISELFDIITKNEAE